jgi:recombinational DNA repair protein (RecF pathway)
MQCEKCQSEVPEDDIYVHAGRKLCEDCYVVALSRPVTCDVGAVHAAKASREMQGQTGTQGLAPLQIKMYDYIKEKGKATREETAEYMNIPWEDLEKQFTVLRHCELMRAFKEGDKVYLTLMEN